MYNEEYAEALEHSLERLKELRDGSLLNIETRFISEYQIAIDDAIEAFEKRIPKNIKHIGATCICPSCGYDAVRYGFFCWNCGQRLYWGSTDD